MLAIARLPFLLKKRKMEEKSVAWRRCEHCGDEIPLSPDDLFKPAKPEEDPPFLLIKEFIFLVLAFVCAFFFFTWVTPRSWFDSPEFLRLEEMFTIAKQELLQCEDRRILERELYKKNCPNWKR